MKKALVIIWAVWALTGLVIAGRAGDEPAAEPTSSPSLQFTQASDGLPLHGIWKSTPALAGVDGASTLMLAAVPRLGDGPHVWVRDEQGRWADRSEGLRMHNSCGGGIAFGDLNKDGHLDLAVADHCRGVYVYTGDGSGNWKAVAEGLNPRRSVPKTEAQDEQPPAFFKGAEDLALGDVNEDGFLDIVAASSDQGGLTVYLGNEAMNWTEARSTGLPTGEEPEPEDENNAGWANQVRLVDINRDGHLDVVASYYKGPAVWLGDGKGHFRSASEGLPRPTIGGIYRGLAIGDLDGDGLPDLVFANEVNGVEVYLQRPGGTWQAVPDVFPALKGGAVAVELGEVTGSGRLDLVVTGRKARDTGNSYGLFVLRGNGKGGFEEVATNLPQTGLSVPWGLAIADFDKTGRRKDLVLTSGGANTGLEKGRVRRSEPEEAAQKPVAELSLPRVQVWLNQAVDTPRTEFRAESESGSIRDSNRPDRSRQ